MLVFPSGAKFKTNQGMNEGGRRLIVFKALQEGKTKVN